MEIILIGAVDKKFHIGKDDSIPWNIPLDRKIFKHFTLNHSIIMGRKTYETIKKPLEKRKNIILTKNQNFKAEGCYIAHSVDESLKLVEGEKAFVIGGEEIYKLFFPISDKIYLTQIDYEFEGNKFFPDFLLKNFNVVYTKLFFSEGYKFTFNIYCLSDNSIQQNQP